MSKPLKDFFVGVVAGVLISLLLLLAFGSIVFYAAYQDNMQPYLITPSLGGQPHIECKSWEFIPSSDAVRCRTNSVYGYDNIGISFDYSSLILQRQLENLSEEECRQFVDVVAEKFKEEGCPLVALEGRVVPE